MTWYPNLRELEYGSLLSYTPRPASDDVDKLERMKESRNIANYLKSDRMVLLDGRSDSNPIPMSGYVAQLIKDNLSTLPFSDYFGGETVLVPVPRSSLTKAGGLWVPERIAEAILLRHLTRYIEKCLIRKVPVRKSAWSAPSERPLPSEHYESLAVQTRLHDVKEIVLVDDVVTRGSQLLGAANKLLDAFPDARIRAFAVMRTISNPHEFEGWFKPVKGKIELRAEGDTIRSP
ncbi:MAG: phosphoribosyltransferase [Nitrososphaerota archaeon]|nr:phosphoribosyltransferase [Nitrososphaerota archaeon]